ncbi:alpha/beta fold hydrolase [Actinoplanes sp. NPDC049668]|uniref:alpha/beta fold hydrolase n=1 Tax=unclassified Actinoplanes TaxID=2626549 RepID=UPI0033BDEA42
MTAELRVLEGGGGDGPVLLLLHGLGATGDVWSGWSAPLRREWPGRWIAPDLPGHGGSAPLAAYTFDALAEAVAGLISPDVPTVVLGHSLGGVVGLALAARRPAAVRGVVGLGIKVAWSDEELRRAQALALRPPAWFPSRDEAAARYLRVAGLDGLLAADDPAVTAGLVRRDDRWGLALDPAAFGVGRPDMPALLAGCPAPVVLARGAGDPMNTDEQLAALGVPAVTLAGVGHNAHVQDPELVFPLLARVETFEPGATEVAPGP